MRQLMLTIVLCLAAPLVVACTSVVEAPSEPQDPAPTQEPAAQTSPGEDAAPDPTGTMAPAQPAEAPLAETGATATLANETAEALPTPEPSPTATSLPEINGEYEGTFYRGLATAPITMIDYSDFL